MLCVTESFGGKYERIDYERDKNRKEVESRRKRKIKVMFLKVKRKVKKKCPKNQNLLLKKI